MLGFETVSLAPIDLALIDAKLLDAGERAWLTGYHARVRKEIAPALAPDEKRWLASVTAKI